MKIFLIGFMGSGKSYWGRALAVELQVPLVEMDEEIVKEQGMSIPGIFAARGESYFRTLERDKLRDVLQVDAFILSCGGGAPCFYDNMAAMNRAGLTIWLDTAVPVMVSRLKHKRYQRPLLKDLDDEQLNAYVKSKLEERRVFYEQAQLIVDPTDLTPASFTEKILSCINHT